jgi:hypothetical protein
VGSAKTSKREDKIKVGRVRRENMTNGCKKNEVEREYLRERLGGKRGVGNG